MPMSLFNIHDGKIIKTFYSISFSRSEFEPGCACRMSESTTAHGPCIICLRMPLAHMIPITPAAAAAAAACALNYNIHM